MKILIYTAHFTKSKSNIDEKFDYNLYAKYNGGVG